jgi:hypothetical protein
MAKTHSAAETVSAILREDGTVYFHYTGRTINERLCEWTLALLWFLVLAVIVTALLWD